MLQSRLQGLVVDQSRRADPRRDGKQRGFVEASDGFERVGVHERQIFGLDLERLHRARGLRQQRLGRTLTVARQLDARSAARSQRQRTLALVAAEPRVATGHRQSVGLAHRGADLDAHGQVKVAPPAGG